MARSKFWRREVGAGEAILLVWLIATIVFLTTRAYYSREDFFALRAREELAPIEAKYGPSKYSENVEEWMIRDYFQDRRGGVFLDVGANHYREDNNTYYLEAALGWSGIAVDALPEFGPDYVKNRPRTKFVPMFASDVAGSHVTFFVPEDNKLVSSSSREFTEKEGAPGQPRQVPTTTLTAVLEQAGISHIDFMSMDIELAEPKALAGFDVDKYRPSLVCIEGHAEVRQQILDYFARHGYTIIGKYLRADPNNLYFTPLR